MTVWSCNNSTYKHTAYHHVYNLREGGKQGEVKLPRFPLSLMKEGATSLYLHLQLVVPRRSSLIQLYKV